MMPSLSSFMRIFREIPGIQLCLLIKVMHFCQSSRLK